MISVICRRPFSELGDQQLLEQTRRLAANQRCIEVHILDHLDEIDRRGLALRRGFSSLFDYAVRELRFSDAAAQRRIQAMRLCRRHGWVRASLQSGELSMTAAAQLETTFAGAERAERQSRTGRRNVGQGRGHDQDHDSAGQTRQLGLPVAPGEAGKQGERGRSLGSPMTALATNGAVAGDQSAPSPGNATGHQDRCTGIGRTSRFADEPSALSVRPSAVGAQPADRLDARATTGSVPPQSALERAPRSEQCSGDAETVNRPALAVENRAGAQDPGAGHAGTPLPRPESNGNASPFPAPSCAPAAAPVAGPAAPSSDEDPALLPPTDLPAQAPAPVPAPAPVLPIAAPSESLRAASHAPESFRDDPFAELSPGRSSAPLLHPQLQRELIEQATGMSTRQVASLLAATAPEVLPPRDTLRAAAPDRYTLKVTIDQECEQGLRRLKDLMSHVDPRMSWGDLVARVVREAVTRHDPRGGGDGQRRRRSAGSAGASPRRAPNKTGAAGAAARRRSAGSAGASPRRAPNKTGAAGAAAGQAQRIQESSPRAPNPTRADGAPAASARRGRGATPAPQGDTAATERQNPIAMLASATPPSQSALAALTDGARAGGVPSGAPATSAPQPAAGASVDGSHPGAGARISPVLTSAPELALAVSSGGGPSDAAAGAAGGASADGSNASAGMPVSPVVTPAPEPVLAVSVSSGGGPSGASAGAAGGASADGFSARAGLTVSPVATSAPARALGVSPAGGPPDSSARAAAHTTRKPPRSGRQSPPRRHIPAAVRRHVWLRDGGRCCYRDPLSGRRCNSSHLLQIDHLLPVAQGGGPEPSNLALRCFAHHRMRHGYGPAAPPEPPM